MNDDIEEIKNFIKKNYDLDIDESERICCGLVNSNYVCATADAKYVFRVYNAKHKKQIGFEVEVLEYLKDKDFPSPRLLPSVNAELVLVFQDKPCVLYNYIEGEDLKEITPELMFQIGEVQAKMHKFLQGFTPSEKKPTWDSRELKILVHENKDRMIIDGPFDAAHLMNFVKEELVKYEFSEHLPTGFTHQDIKPENIIVKNGKINGLIDFDNAYLGVLLHDITTPIIWSCFVDEKLNTGLLNSFLGGYNQERQMTEQEQKCLLDGIKFRLVREVFIGPFAATNPSELPWERANYFMRLYNNIAPIKNI